MFPQIFGKYVLEREIAAGGMAVVYLGTLRGAGGFEKRLIVKQIRAELASDEAFVRRFVEEAKTTVELSHPNIVPVYELGVEQGVYYIAMEWAEGLTLADLVRASGALSPEEGAYLGVEICRALDYAHRRAGIVHRDVTPRNVVIDEEGAVRLIDFGIAAPATEDGASRREKVFGSPGHMPSEQIQGGRLTPATDVFAVGALLIEAWTGEAPFRRSTRQESDSAIEHAPPPLSECIPSLRPLDDLIARSVALEQKDRPQSAEELARPLRAFLRASDLGDIARRLAERVRAERKEPEEAPETGPYQTPRTRPLAASTGSGSRTFAADERMEEWTRGISTRPPPGPEDPARLAEIVPLAPVPSDLREGAAPVADDLAATEKHPAPRRSWGRWAAAVGVLAAGTWWLVVPGRSAQPPVQRPPRSVPTAPSVTAPPSAGKALSSRNTSQDAAVTRDGAADASAATVNTGSSATVSRAARVSSGTPRPSVRASDTALRAGPVRDAAPASGAASADPAALAQLTLTSDLPARVLVNGRALGTTPVRTRWPSGTAQVVFESLGEFNERLQTTVDLDARTPLGLHAAFRRARPLVLRR